MSKTAIIIGAGPAGLTAAYELLHKTNIKPIILEKTSDTGGLSKTVNYKGNRIDIGGHRFFSKSEKVMRWWLNILSLEKTETEEFSLHYQNKQTQIFPRNYSNSNNENEEKVMLVRNRVSHIYYLKKFFTYPVTISWDTIRKLGFTKIIRIFFSYSYIRLFPRKDEKTLEDFFINRFGKNLYRTFFKDYTEKVWGIPCSEIPAEWGAQRIKELSITKALLHSLKKKLPFRKKEDLAQKDTSTSLIQRFLYPKYGPGQLWEEVANIIKAKGGEIHYNQDVTRITTNKNKIISVEAVPENGTPMIFNSDYFFSTMPVKELIAGIKTGVPEQVAKVAEGLQYRDFITVGLLVKKLKVGNKNKTIKDNWIYIQENEVKAGRLQIFNNWSPYLVKDPSTTWVGLEYFCNKEDAFWQLSDEEIKKIAIHELAKIDLIEKEDVLDHTLIRMEKTYPAYFGTYNQFHLIREYLDQFENLFLIGRNGMHKYNNADHSMLTAMAAVDNIILNSTSKQNIWDINSEQDYQE
ncbi:NAD(P)/FAD-dependent oxidoreductase [Terrimonas alba]|uniref:NAD(P)/FAD-dependent oxidoreductase n=1 Tax=Terrimonas alba TaxID=3349636 RepID=UPI0035F3B17E